MKKIFEIALGIVTSVGGFLEIGSIATAAQAGAWFRFQLIWAIVLGGLCLIFLVEQSGRLAAVSGHTLTDAIRERFALNYFVFMFLILTLVSVLVLTAEIGGVCVALEIATGVRFQWWAGLVGLIVWLLLWKGTFGVIEKGVSLLGLITLCFIIGVLILRPSWHEVLRGVIPGAPQHDKTRYWFIAVSILGASISPYLYLFYSSGAIEDKWDESYLGTNRVIAATGMSFGSVISVAVLVLAGLVFLPAGIKVDHYSELKGLLIPAFGSWGVTLLVASLAIACIGAALEIALQIAYFAAQGFGWNWSENQKPRDEARFSLTYTIVVVVASLIILLGVDPLQLTIFSMVLTAATLPVSIVPLLILMNDPRYLEDHCNGWVANAVVIFIVALAFVLAIVSFPLQVFGGG
jgi:Mn2+/Fe2+ NRAMP family transporter